MSTGEITKTTMEDLAVLAESAQVTDVMRLLDRTARANQQMLDRHRQLEEAQAERLGVAPSASGTAGEDNMNVYLNSPITYNPTAEAAAMSSTQTTTQSAPISTTPLWQKALLAAALALGSAGIGALIPWVFGAFDKPEATQTFTNTLYELSIKPALGDSQQE